MSAQYLIENINNPKEIILKADYIFFDPSLWPDAHYILENLKLTYELIGLNIFEDKNITPTLVSLKRVNNALKEELWEEIGSYTFMDAASQFDQMSMFQNYIVSEKSIYDIKIFLAEMMQLKRKGKTYLFRMFDSRAMLHCSALFNFNNKPDFTQNQRFKAWQSHVKEWFICLAGRYYKIRCPYKFSNYINFQQVNFEDMMQITENLRANMMPASEAEHAERRSDMVLEELLHSEYIKILEQ